MKTLDQLSIGEEKKVLRLNGTPAIRRRLMEMGMSTNAMVRLIRRAPLGDPLDVKIRGYHLSLRKEEAAAVEVE